MNKLYKTILGNSQKNKKQFAVLIDPDKSAGIGEVIEKSEDAGVNYFFVGGSLLTSYHLEKCVELIKEKTKIPVILFPGSSLQLSKKVDAVLFLSLISGRNPEFLIGKHVSSATFLKTSGLEIIPTGYMLIDGGKPTTASYISNTAPIPSDKGDIAMCTAIAGEMLGLKLIYMDAGSGAAMPIKKEMIEKVKQNISVPLIVGGGIVNPAQAKEACLAGADLIVVGNAIERDNSLINKIATAVHAIGV